MMNFSAYTVPNLRIGSTFDCNTAKNGSDVFAPNILTETENVNAFSFRYKIVKSNDDVRELLNLPCDLSLRIKANLHDVEGPGKYIKDLKIADGKTEILAVMKCTAISRKIEDSARPKEDIQRDQLAVGLGTHYVKRVSYGGQMVASIKISLPASAARTAMTGFVQGELTSQDVDTALSSQLDALSAECRDASDISITCYTTEMPDRPETLGTIEELMNLFRSFKSNIINSRQEIAVEIELQPIESLIRTEKAYFPNRVLANALEEVESRFDDLRSSQFLLKQYVEAAVELDEDVKRFGYELQQVSQTFIAAISKLNVSADENQFNDCLKAYGDALEGFDEEGKFVQSMRKLRRKNEFPIPSTAKIQVPPGKDLTIFVIGKAGSGKSATANSIVGKPIFATSAGATSVSSQFQCGTRTDERKITVLDTPGFLESDVLREVPRMLEWAPHGIDAIILVAKYGSRFNVEDAQALQQLQGFLGEGGVNYIILVLTYGDQVEHEVKEAEMPDACVDLWLGTLPDWVQMFIDQIKERVVLFNNRLKPDRHPEAYKKQLSDLIKLIDGITQKVPPYLNTEESRKNFIKGVEVALAKRDQELKERQASQKFIPRSDKITQRKPTSKSNAQDEEWLMIESEEETALADDQTFWLATVPAAVWNALGGCFPASAILNDRHGQRRRMDSLRIGDEVQVITNNEVHLDTVFSFIHRQPEVVQEFLKITTKGNKILKITEDHMLFMQKCGQPTAIPARDAKVGDTVYVRGKHGVERDAVQSISSVYEKGVYAPVTLSGTILVNDVHTSCYFDVLSHDWSHRAMGLARVVHYVSPWMVQWISGIGEKDGFPGWCRLAHKMLTFWD